MKFTNAIAGAALFTSVAVAQGITYNNVTNTFSCGVPNGTYCLGGPIILRCSNGVGHAGNCNDNLAGEPPVGVGGSNCFSCGENTGRAACSKAGIVYPSSGTGLGNATFPSNNTVICSAAAPYPAGNSTVMPTGTGATGTGATGTGSSGVPSRTAPSQYTGAASPQMLGAGTAGAIAAAFAAIGLL